MKRRLLGLLAACLLLAGTSAAQGLLPVSELPPVSDTDLATLIDTYIPEYHSTILIFTQCFGGNFLLPFAGRERTVAMSASGPGTVSYYGGFHDDAARALTPSEGKTSHDIFTAGQAGKNSKETPLITGEAIPYEPVSADGEIRSRHVLVYAALPESLDRHDFRRIQQALSAEPNTTVTLVARSLPADHEEASTWKPDYPPTLAGLQAALEEIGESMNEHEQFVLFVTDHGSRRPISETFNVGPNGSHAAALALTAEEVEFMNSDAAELGKVGFLLFLPDAEEAPTGDDLVITLDHVKDTEITASFAMPAPIPGYNVFFELDYAEIDDALDPVNNLTAYVYNRTPLTFTEMVLSVLLTPMPKFGYADFTVSGGSGSTGAPDSFTAEAGVHPVFQFEMTNDSILGSLFLYHFLFEAELDALELFAAELYGLELYEDVDGDGQITAADELIGEAFTDPSDPGRFIASVTEPGFELEPGGTTTFVLGIRFKE